MEIILKSYTLQNPAAEHIKQVGFQTLIIIMQREYLRQIHNHLHHGSTLWIILMHVGIDVASRNGNSSVYAVANGTISKTGYNSSNGNYVIIKHSLNGKTVYSFYAHLSKINTSQGKSVNKGTTIGIYGNTGSGSAGTHLHFAIVDTLWSGGGYYGYVTNFSGNKAYYDGVTYYNPHYVISNNRLP